MIRRNPVLKQIVCGAILALALTGYGCLSIQSQSSLDGSPAASSAQPYVEMYVEYPGPQAKWSGPQTFVLHVSAKDSGEAQITATPVLLADDGKDVDLPKDAPTTSTARTPASEGEAAHEMTSEEARALMDGISNAIQGAAAPFRGCMYPVRVRLVRADGGLIEKLGCRSEVGWARTVSDAVNVFMSAANRG